MILLLLAVIVTALLTVGLRLEANLTAAHQGYQR